MVIVTSWTWLSRSAAEETRMKRARLRNSSRSRPPATSSADQANTRSARARTTSVICTTPSSRRWRCATPDTCYPSGSSIASPPPAIAVVRNDFKNVPRQALRGNFLHTPLNLGSESFYFENPTDSPGAIAQLKHPRGGSLGAARRGHACSTGDDAYFIGTQFLSAWIIYVPVGRCSCWGCYFSTCHFCSPFGTW